MHIQAEVDWRVINRANRASLMNRIAATSRVSIMVAALGLGTPLFAAASQLVPSQGDVHLLGLMTVITYFEPEADGLHVVLTISKTDGDPSSILRVSTILKDGQETVLSVPRAVGEPPSQLVVARVGSRIDVTAPLTQ